MSETPPTPEEIAGRAHDCDHIIITHVDGSTECADCNGIEHDIRSAIEAEYKRGFGDGNDYAFHDEEPAAIREKP